MESYYNMNPSDNRCCRNMMNQNCKPYPPMRPMPRSCNGPYGNVRSSMNNNNNMAGCKTNPEMMHVECECKIAPNKNCHKTDPMEQLGSNFPTVMAYVPWQQWGELYDANCALMQGTLFKELNLKFCGVRC